MPSRGLPSHAATDDSTSEPALETSLPPPLPPPLHLPPLTLSVRLRTQPLEPRLPAGALAAGHPLPTFELDTALAAMPHRRRATTSRRPRQNRLPVRPVITALPLPLARPAIGGETIRLARIPRPLTQRTHLPTNRATPLARKQVLRGRSPEIQMIRPPQLRILPRRGKSDCGVSPTYQEGSGNFSRQRHVDSPITSGYERGEIPTGDVPS
jgi:hypothetical protein